MSRKLIHTMIGLFALLCAGCNASYPFQPSNPVPTSLRIIYQAAMGPALVGQSFGFTAYVLDSYGGVQDVTANATWLSSNTNVIALVANPSRFTAIAPGVADISATYQGMSNTLSLSVIEADRQFPSLAITGLSTLPPRAVGQTASLSAVLRFSVSQSQNVTSQAIWSSSDPDVLTVTLDGSSATVTGMTVGTAVITATFNGLTANYGLSVHP
jgi:trimeric autotransporter adhesin